MKFVYRGKAVWSYIQVKFSSYTEVEVYRSKNWIFFSQRGLVTSRVSVSSQSTAALKDQSQPTIAIPRDQGKVFSKVWILFPFCYYYYFYYCYFYYYYYYFCSLYLSISLSLSFSLSFLLLFFFFFFFFVSNAFSYRFV